MSVNIIHSDHKVGGQELTATVVAESGGARWKATLCKDFYPQQSYAKVVRWDGSQWQFVLDFNMTGLGLNGQKHSHAKHGDTTWKEVATADAVKMIEIAAACVG